MNSRTVAILLAATTLAATFSGSLLTPSEKALPSLRIDSAQLLASAQHGEFTLDLAGVPYTFDVKPHPIAEGAVVGIDGVAVGRVTETTTFSGTANGLPALVATTDAGVLLAILGPDPVFVEPTWWSRPGAALDEHRILRWSHDPPIIPDHPDPSPATATSHPALDAGEAVIPRNRTVQFLIENDYEFHKKFTLDGKCSSCWVQVQQAVMLIAEANFRRDAHIRFNITSQWTCSTATSCPYDDTGGLYDQDNWGSNFNDRWEGITTEPDHDLGHLLIATDLDGGGGPSGGAACLGCVGSIYGYGLSEFGTPANTASTGTLTQYAVATHEIGHNFNATHSRAAPIPPALGFVPPQGHGRAWTVMMPEQPVVFQFSDGSYAAFNNNLRRILAHAAETLPA